jgi:hypothetical protein
MPALKYKNTCNKIIQFRKNFKAELKKGYFVAVKLTITKYQFQTSES